MKAPNASLFLISTFLTACSASSRAHESRSVGIDVPMEIASNKPWVQVRVNGSEPQWFILDTGCAGGSVVARAAANRLGLRLGDETQAADLGAGEGVKLTVTSARDVALDIHGVALRPDQVGVFPFDHVEPYEGRALDGLLGADFMREHVVEIDYAHKKLKVFDPAAFEYGGNSAPIPITFHDGLVVAEAKMKPPGRTEIRCQVVIDTGVRTTVVWFSPFVKSENLLASQTRLVTGTIGGGAGGETKGDIGRLESLTIGTLEIAKPIVVFSRDTTGVFAGEDEAGIVGGEILRQCRVTFDYPHQRLYLEPNPGAFESFDGDMSGLFLVSAAPKFERVVIQSVAAGTPAADAGLEKGDEIVAIDQRSIGGRTLDEVRDLFKQEGATYRVGIKRGADERVVTMKLRRLV
jgi:hypothetical protein